MLQARFNFYQRPDIVSLLGEALFVKCPLYESKLPMKTLYVNQNLYEEIFGERATSFEKMAATISHHFYCTLEQRPGAQQIGWAYADRQADPMGLSLSGNLGSGRAYYLGPYFNIKGEKTPLAVSKDLFHSNGKLELREAIWESLVANSLHQSSALAVAPILAILIHEEELCEVQHFDKPVQVPRARIIRIVKNCPLERITHLFYKQKPENEVALKKIAVHFGELEANKFIERVLHGCWSAGNISPRGDLIDLQSSCATLSRTPQFSAANSYPSNYFGYEYLGQTQILKALAEDKQINVAGFSHESLEETLLEAQERRLLEGLLYLMGFPGEKEIISRYREALLTLSRLFSQLARKAWMNLEGFFVCSPLSFSNYCFDFSWFFRFYPLLKRSENFSVEDCLDKMSLKHFSERLNLKPYLEQIQGYFSEAMLHFQQLSIEDKVLLKQIKTWFSCDFIKNEKEYAAALDLVKLFIQLYDALHCQILENFAFSAEVIEARAYKINEDRAYLMPCLSAVNRLVKNINKYSAKQLHLILSLIIKASRRKPSLEEAVFCDFILYHEGYSALRLNGDGTQQFFIYLFKSQFSQEEFSFTDSDFEFSCAGKLLRPYQIQNKKEHIEISSPVQSTQILLGLDRGLAQRELKIFYKKKPIILNKI